MAGRPRRPPGAARLHLPRQLVPGAAAPRGGRLHRLGGPARPAPHRPQALRAARERPLRGGRRRRGVAGLLARGPLLRQRRLDLRPRARQRRRGGARLRGDRRPPGHRATASPASGSPSTAAGRSSWWSRRPAGSAGRRVPRGSAPAPPPAEQGPRRRPRPRECRACTRGHACMQRARAWQEDMRARRRTCEHDRVMHTTHRHRRRRQGRGGEDHPRLRAGRRPRRRPRRSRLGRRRGHPHVGLRPARAARAPLLDALERGPEGRPPRLKRRANQPRAGAGPPGPVRQPHRRRPGRRLPGRLGRAVAGALRGGGHPPGRQRRSPTGPCRWPTWWWCRWCSGRARWTPSRRSSPTTPATGCCWCPRWCPRSRRGASSSAWRPWPTAASRSRRRSPSTAGSAAACGGRRS